MLRKTVPPHDQEQQLKRIHSERYRILLAVMLGSIMAPIDASIVNVTLPTIAQFFHVGLATAQWVPMIYLLTVGSLLMFFGRLGDMFGYKRIYLYGLAGFTVSSALCALAPSISWLIVFRAFQGVAAGMMMSMPFALITSSFPPQERGKALGINAISISAGLAIGPALGGFLTAAFGWPSIFLINLPVGMAGLFWGARRIPDSKGVPAGIDIPGVVLGSLSLLCLLLFVTRLQTSGLTFSAWVLAFTALALSVAFILVEKKSPEPMLRLGLFRSPVFSLTNISSLLNFMSQYIMVFLTPFYLQKILRLSPDRIGIVMTSFPLAVMSVASFAGALSDRVGTTKLAFAGALTCALSLYLMSTVSDQALPGAVAWKIALFGLGTGMFQAPNNSAAMGSAPKHHLGVASGILATVRTVGMVLGIASAGAVLAAYASPAILQKTTLVPAETAVFLAALAKAYLAGALLTGTAAVTSLVTAGNYR